MAATRRCGFTLVELMVCVATVGILCAISVETYRNYAIRAQLAQQLLAVGHIKESIFIEAHGGNKDDTTLADGAVAGKAPPHLAGPVTDAEFNGADGLRMELVYLPTAFLASFPQGGYGLVVDSSLPAGIQRVRLFYQQADRSGLPIAWLSDTSFIIGLIDVSRIDSGTGGGACPPGWTQHGNSGNCSPPHPGDPCPPGFSPIGNSGQCRPS
jgi:prepilin-type N-terminal cleavage/methylation domain-containing protein